MMQENISSNLIDLIELYKIANMAEGKSPKTISGYDDFLKTFARYAIGTYNKCDLTVFDVQIIRKYILFLQKRPKISNGHELPNTCLSPFTIQDNVRALKAFSTWLNTDGYTEENRLKNLKIPKAPKTMITVLTKDEINSIIDSIKRSSLIGARNYAIFSLDLDSGLRESELAGILLNNVDLNNGFIKVMGKGQKERIVPIGKQTRMVLFSYINKERMELNSHDSNFLFLSSRSTPITANAIKLMFSRLAKTSGVRRLHCHLCRHTFATNYLLNGGDIFSLKEILGHTTFEMVNRYLHFTNSQITQQHHKYSPMDKFFDIKF